MAREEAALETASAVAEAADAAVPSARWIVLACHNKELRVKFTGRGQAPYAELKRLYYEAFKEIEHAMDMEPTCKEYVDDEMPAFELLDNEFGVLYEGFSDSDIKDGSLIKVKPALIKTAAAIRSTAWQRIAWSGCTSTSTSDSASTLQRPQSHRGREKSAEQTPCPDTTPAEQTILPGQISPAPEALLMKPQASSIAQPILEVEEEVERLAPGPGDIRELDSCERKSKMDKYKSLVWRTIDDPLSSNMASFLTLLIVATIILSAVVYIVQTFPFFNNHKGASDGLFYAETATILIFTLELAARVWSFPKGPWEFWLDAFNVVDMVAIVPYYIEVFLMAIKIQVPALLWMTRVIRIVRLVKISKGSVSVFSTTMSASIKLMYLLLLMMSLVTLVAGSLLYYVERGTWNPILMAYQRDYRYHCPITVDPNLPMPESHACNDPGLCQPVPGAPGEFVCLYTWKRSPDCKLERREGPYKSILHATWFVMQTITTVGFGDDVPTSPLGKSLTSILIMFGLVVVSLPITVIGAKFSHTYRAHCRTVARREEEMNFESLSLLKRVTYRLIYS